MEPLNMKLHIIFALESLSTQTVTFWKCEYMTVLYICRGRGYDTQFELGISMGHVIKMSLGGACQTSLGPHVFTIAPD